MRSSGVNRRLAVIVLDRGEVLEEFREDNGLLYNRDEKPFFKCGESGVYSAIFENPGLDETSPIETVVGEIVKATYEKRQQDLRDATGFVVYDLSSQRVESGGIEYKLSIRFVNHGKVL